MSDIQLYSAFDPRLIQFGPLEKTKRGSKIIPVNYPGKRRICLQSAVVSCPFGVNKPYQDGGDIQSHSIDISFRGYDTNPAVGTFLDKMRQLDATLLDHAVKESTELFGKPLSKDLVEEFFRPLVREPKDSSYAPTMKLKIPVINQTPNAIFFDEDRQQVSMEAICKGASARFIMELSGVWFVNKQFGLSWRMVQCAITNRPARIEGFGFVDDGEDVKANGFIDE